MKKGLLSFLAAGVLCVALLAVACGNGEPNGGKDTTTTPGSSSGTGGKYPEMPAVAGTIKEHTLAELEKNTNCLSCHSSNDTKRGQIRMPAPAGPSGTEWYSYVQKATFTVKAGTPQDHTSVTNTMCYNSGCHALFVT